MLVSYLKAHLMTSVLDPFCDGYCTSSCISSCRISYGHLCTNRPISGCHAWTHTRRETSGNTESRILTSRSSDSCSIVGSNESLSSDPLLLPSSCRTLNIWSVGLFISSSSPLSSTSSFSSLRKTVLWYLQYKIVRIFEVLSSAIYL